MDSEDEMKHFKHNVFESIEPPKNVDCKFLPTKRKEVLLNELQDLSKSFQEYKVDITIANIMAWLMTFNVDHHHQVFSKIEEHLRICEEMHSKLDELLSKVIYSLPDHTAK